MPDFAYVYQITPTIRILTLSRYSLIFISSEILCSIMFIARWAYGRTARPNSATHMHFRRTLKRGRPPRASQPDVSIDITASAAQLILLAAYIRQPVDAPPVA